MGLNDRNYMYEPRGGSGSGSNSLDNWRTMMWVLIGINAAFFFIIAPPGSQLYAQLGLTLGGVESLQFYRLVTAGFLHGSFSHILFNMYGLYLFGSLIGPHLGGKRFLLLYLVGVLAGNLLFLVYNLFTPSFLIGASGAVYAVIVAAALLEPNRQFVMLFMPRHPLKTSTLAIVYVVLEVVSQLLGANNGVAHLAHLGGALGGYLLLKYWFRNRLPWDPFRRRLRPGEWQRTPPPGERWGGFSSASRKTTPSGSVSSRELDALLDKISRHGINSLTEHELARLRQAREEMRGK